MDVNRRGEAKREEAVRFAQDTSGDIGEGCCNRGSFWVGDWGKARSKETSLCTGRGGRPLLNRGAAALATCWGEGGLDVFLVLPPQPEPEAA